MNYTAQALFILFGPILSMAFGFWMCKLFQKKHKEEVIDELLRLRAYNEELLKKLSKEKQVLKGVRDFLQEGNKD